MCECVVLVCTPNHERMTASITFILTEFLILILKLLDTMNNNW